MKKNTATAAQALSAEMIQAIIDARGDNIYVMTEFSRSGMSRRLSFRMIFDGRLVEINNFIKPGLSPGCHWIRVDGYGFDAIACELSSLYGRNGIPDDFAYRYNRIYTK